MRQHWLTWPLFAALMGLAFGGGLTWGIMYSPPQHHAANNQQPDEHPTGKENKNGFWEKAGDDPVAYFTLWLVGFTGVLAISTIGLWIVTWRASASQARDMQASIKTAERSARAAEEATRLSEQHLVSVERAFVFAKGNTMVAIRDADGKMRAIAVTMIWENSGSTPTRNAFNHLSLGSYPFELDDNFGFHDVPWGPEGRQNTPIFLGPKAILASSSAEIPIEALIAADANESHVYLWGWVEYDDIFAGSQRHRTEFCFKIVPVDLASGKIRTDLHRVHNGADGDCFRRLNPQTNRYS